MTSSPASRQSFRSDSVPMSLISPSIDGLSEQNPLHSLTRQPCARCHNSCCDEVSNALQSSNSKLMNIPPLPYWQVNVPPHLREPLCPDFLLNCDAKDEAILSTPDTAYQRISWPKAKEIALASRMDLFARVPSELRAYKKFMLEVKQRHGSIMNFILRERLKWEIEGAEGRLVAKGKPFEEPSKLFSTW